MDNNPRKKEHSIQNFEPNVRHTLCSYYPYVTTSNRIGAIVPIKLNYKGIMNNNPQNHHVQVWIKIHGIRTDLNPFPRERG